MRRFVLFFLSLDGFLQNHIFDLHQSCGAGSFVFLSFMAINLMVSDNWESLRFPARLHDGGYVQFPVRKSCAVFSLSARRSRGSMASEKEFMALSNSPEVNAVHKDKYPRCFSSFWKSNTGTFTLMMLRFFTFDRYGRLGESSALPPMCFPLITGSGDDEVLVCCFPKLLPPVHGAVCFPARFPETVSLVRPVYLSAAYDLWSRF